MTSSARAKNRCDALGDRGASESYAWRLRALRVRLRVVGACRRPCAGNVHFLQQGGGFSFDAPVKLPS